MMDSNKCVLFLIICSWGASLSSSEDGGGISTAGDTPGAVPCAQKLLPCQPYLHSPSPPSSCCAPLKRMISDDAHCLCAVFNNAAILKSLNITQADALNLAKACGANADISVCKNEATSPTGSPTTPATPSDGSSNNSTGSATTKNSASWNYNFSASTLVALVAASVIISAF
ncbi:non-specific lipid transfer protein GPI-anchored 3-like [Malania oleifera]|uniref:non-specific lipid transfer protein GPI-anchored 3-like n=1 Tax=Malania oleifera TaxID=397392 RepID=UPI0025AEC677|nr:non-specific lipid transfer protein GPI-anchored 3-like [Malania oleifera]